MMKEYHKIPTVYKRDPENNYKTLLEGQFATPELEYLKDNMWNFTEKIDGMNIRVMYHRDANEVVFGGKSDTTQFPKNIHKRLGELFTWDRMNEAFPDCESLCLYGEGFGAGIQKGGRYIENQDFILFDVKVGDWWLQRKDVIDIAEKLGCQVVPTVGSGSLIDMINMVRDGFMSMWGDFKAEGIVARPTVELFDRAGRRIITKIKHKDFP